MLELLDLLSWFDWLAAFGWLVCLVSWVGRLGWDGWFDFKLVDNANKQAASYLRRRDQWIHTAYQRHFDTQRGRVQDRTRRTEAQKRGHLHDHICEYHEKCGLLFPGAGDWKRHCRSVSNVCLKTGEQCRLSQHCASSKRHQQNHTGEVIAELVRPYPIGSVSAGPPLLPKVRGSSRTETMSAIEMGMWSKDRTKDPFLGEMRRNISRSLPEVHCNLRRWSAAEQHATEHSIASRRLACRILLSICADSCHCSP